MTYRKVLAAALELPEKERGKLVEELQSSLPPEELSEEWLAEIERRTHQYQSGKANVLTWDEFKRRAGKRREKPAKK